jgi:hypothetical protein
MLRSKRLDDEAVAKFKAPAKRITLPDPELRGHYIRVTPSGSKSFWAVARDPSGKQHWQLIGQLRSQRKVGAYLRKYIIPAFAGMEFVDVRRKHITTLLDRIEDRHGVRQSDYGLSILSGICSWYAKRDEDYGSPIIRGMKRQKKCERDRVLTSQRCGKLTISLATSPSLHY